MHGQKVAVKEAKEFLGPSIIKLIIQPLIILPLLLLFGVEPLSAAAAFIAFSLPTAAFLYILAQEYKLYVDHSEAIVIGTTVLSIFSLPAYILIAKLVFAV